MDKARDVSIYRKNRWKKDSERRRSINDCHHVKLMVMVSYFHEKTSKLCLFLKKMFFLQYKIRINCIAYSISYLFQLL